MVYYRIVVSSHYFDIFAQGRPHSWAPTAGCLLKGRVTESQGRSVRWTVLVAALMLTLWASPPRAVAFEGDRAGAEEVMGGEEEGVPVPLLYHEAGNGVETAPKVHVIFWGSNFEAKGKGEHKETSEQELKAAKVREMLLKLYEGMTGSAYEGILTQYFNSTAGATGRVGSTVTTTSWIDNSVEAPLKLTETEVEEEVSKGIVTNKWTPEPNAQFVIVTAPGSTYESSFIGTGTCAYHEQEANGVVYDFVPYQGEKPFTEGPEPCITIGNASGNAVYKTSKSASHEFAEAATDPGGNTWYRIILGKHREIADLCQGAEDFELPDGAWAQELYDDHENECSTRDPAPPHVYAISEAPISKTSTSVRLHGIVNAEAVATNYYFEVGLTTSYGTRTAEVSAGSGATKVEAEQTVCGLAASTKYDYRVAATNSTGTTYGQNGTFTTEPPGESGCPSATTESAATGVKEEATLNGTVNPNGYTTKYYFEYGTSALYGKKTTEASAGSGSSGVKESQTITGLSREKEYHFRLIASNANGTAYGADKTFTTPGTVAITEPATGVTATEAILHGIVVPNGSATKDQFEYGTTVSYGTSVPGAAESAGSGNVEIAKGYILTGLLPSTTYHFRLSAPNGGPTVHGKDATFTTESLTSTFSFTFGSGGTGNGQFNEPTGIAVDPINGNVVVSDEKNNRIQVFNEKGEFQRKFGTEGTGHGQFKEPRGVAVDSKGNVWVTDTGNDRVEEFNETGGYLSEFGTKGTGNGKFTEPKGVSVTSKGNIWVTDSGDKRVEEFNEKGEYLRQFSTGTNPVGVAADSSGNVWSDSENETGAIEEHGETGSLIQSFGARGEGNGYVSEPRRLAVLNGYVWVADANNNRVEVFNEKGEYMTKFGTKGTGSEQMEYPVGVAVDERGNVWVADGGNNRVDNWGIASPWPPTVSTAFGSSGSGSGQFNGPTGIATNPINSDVVVADEKNNRIQVFNETGEIVQTFGSEGTGHGKLKEPRGLATDSKGNVWVADTGNNRVDEFTETGEYVSQFGTKGTSNGQFVEPKGLAVDAKGNIWVADSANNRVEEFNEKYEYVRQFSTGIDPVGVAVDSKGNVWSDDEAATGAIEEHSEKGAFLQRFATRGGGNGQVYQPARLAFDSTGYLWVADGGNNRIEVFNEAGGYVTQFGLYGSGSGGIEQPRAVTVDPRGNVWVADGSNNRVDRWIR
jgi:DNA-binding beta-propeller fold protein YncE